MADVKAREIMQRENCSRELFWQRQLSRRSHSRVLKTAEFNSHDGRNGKKIRTGVSVRETISIRASRTWNTPWIIAVERTVEKKRKRASEKKRIMKRRQRRTIKRRGSERTRERWKREVGAKRRQIQRGLLVEVPGARYPQFWETCSASLLGVPNSSLIYDWHSLPFFERGGRERTKEDERGREEEKEREES